MDWDEANQPGVTLSGVLTRVECSGKQLALSVREPNGKVQRMQVSDISQIEITGGDGTLTCGAQKARPVRIRYVAATDKAKGFAGEVTGIELR